MNLTSEMIKERLALAGVYASGIAAVAPVDEVEVHRYARWISDGMNSGMEYMANHADLRRDPSLLLPGAVSLISCAFNYYHPLTWRHNLRWARYALGRDYHEVVRERLQGVASWLTSETGAECRVCVDTAPLRERYWAVQAGVGFVGLNNQLIIPGAGSHFFLGEILTTLPLVPDSPCRLDCGSCGKCLKACPGKAIIPCSGVPDSDYSRSQSFIDSSRCLSYLTIEHRGDFPEGSPRLGNHIYGCDVCQEICPHNSNPPVTDIPEFIPRTEILALDREAISGMSQQEFSRIFTHSAVKRTKLAGLQRNNRAVNPQDDVSAPQADDSAPQEPRFDIDPSIASPSGNF